MTNPLWIELLEKAVTEPGTVSECYRRFHDYSLGNQLLAMFQCEARGIALGPIGTFMHWKDCGRFVRKGERAISLCMPVSGKRMAEKTDDSGQTSEVEIGFTRFVYRNNWFVLSQTDGSDYVTPELPGWDAETALAALDIKRVEFSHTNGNVAGYAKGREIAISPIGDHQHATMFHELAHVVLGHTAEGALNSDSSDRTPKDIRELEAESVAMLCCASLGLSGVEQSRGYIQSWFSGKRVPERSAQRIFGAADKILKAGRAV